MFSYFTVSTIVVFSPNFVNLVFVSVAIALVPIFTSLISIFCSWSVKSLCSAINTPSSYNSSNILIVFPFRLAVLNVISTSTFWFSFSATNVFSTTICFPSIVIGFPVLTSIGIAFNLYSFPTCNPVIFTVSIIVVFVPSAKWFFVSELMAVVPISLICVFGILIISESFPLILPSALTVNS